MSESFCFDGGQCAFGEEKPVLAEQIMDLGEINCSKAQAHNLTYAIAPSRLRIQQLIPDRRHLHRRLQNRYFHNQLNPQQ